MIRPFRTYQFVLIDPRFTFFDRIEYLGSTFLGIVGLILAMLGLWQGNAVLDYIGWGLIFIVLTRVKAIYRKFVVPFNEKDKGKKFSPEQKNEI